MLAMQQIREEEERERARVKGMGTCEKVLMAILPLLALECWRGEDLACVLSRCLPLLLFLCALSYSLWSYYIPESVIIMGTQGAKKRERKNGAGAGRSLAASRAC